MYLYLKGKSIIVLQGILMYMDITFNMLFSYFFFYCCSSTVVSISPHTTLHDPSQPHLPPSILFPFSFVHVPFIHVL